MSAFPRGHRKSENQPDGVPASKKPRSDNRNGVVGSFDEDDPFADDITGEEWEFAASQAEFKHSEQKQRKGDKPSCSTSYKQPQSYSRQTANELESKSIAALRSKLFTYETKIDELQSSFDRKNGETLLLRDRLSNAEKQLNQEKMKIIEMQTIQEKHNFERDKSMQKQIEKCKDEVQFKQAELQESQNLIRNLENKVKSLEHQNSTLKSRSPVKYSSACGEGMKFGGLPTSQNRQYVAETSNAKRIKLIKPESPRISSRSMLHAEFTDKPFEISKNVSAPVNDKVGDPCPTENQTFALKTLPQQWKLQSKILQRGSRGHSILQSVTAGFDSVSITPKTDVPSIFQIIGTQVTNSDTRGLSENLKRYLSSIPKSITLFDDSCSQGVSFVDDASGLLNVIRNHIKTFAYLQNIMLQSENGSTTESSSFHTAFSEVNPTVNVKTCDKVSGQDVNMICQNALSSLHVLLVICEHLPKVCDSKESQEILSMIGKLCNIAQWNPKTHSKDDILSLMLQILTVHAKYSKTSMHLKIYEQVVKIDLLLALVKHKNGIIQCIVLDLLNAIISFYPAFALNLIKSEVDCASILCHITDLIGIQTTLKDKSRFELLMKSLQFLSSLVANHQSLLIEHSCFSEIYNGVDSLLYSELRLWKADGDEMRHYVIKSALCLLHSCVGVYSDSIPGSRRMHSHQFAMMLLSEFFHENSDEASFWSAELGRIIETEVKSVYEEGDSI